jgi:3-dehydroquinate dehydratase/shikimate dehydrogenase
MTYLTVPISAEEIKEANRQIQAAKRGGAEAVELRCDYLKNLSVETVRKLFADARKEISIPIIVTCRERSEGGVIDYPLKLRLEVLAAAIEAGADFIDFEYENFKKLESQEKIKRALEKNKKTRLILSAHNFKTRFENIERLYSDICSQYPAAIPKIVYTANHINDCFEAFDLLHNSKGDSIVLCMGEAGLVSRIITKKLGGLVTYTSLDEKSATAAGQVTIEDMKKLYRWDAIDVGTEIYGIIGSPVAHSLSPVIHNKCFEEIGASKLYLPLLVEGGKEQFNQFVENCLEREWLDFRGFSITIPHKENALNFVREKGGVVEPLAEKIGAVNTLIIEPRVAAYNTDYAGAMDAITGGMGIKREDLKDLPVAVIGAGGVARAIVAGLSDCGVKIKIYNRTIKRAETLAREFNCEFGGLEELAKLNAKLVINCTSIGMQPKVKETPILKGIIEEAQRRRGNLNIEYRTRNIECRSKDRIAEGIFVFDTVYNPAETLLLKQAKEAGAKTITGLDMFVNQAVEQFKLFTGKVADLNIMRKIITKKP